MQLAIVSNSMWLSRLNVTLDVVMFNASPYALLIDIADDLIGSVLSPKLYPLTTIRACSLFAWKDISNYRSRFGWWPLLERTTCQAPGLQDDLLLLCVLPNQPIIGRPVTTCAYSPRYQL